MLPACLGVIVRMDLVQNDFPAVIPTLQEPLCLRLKLFTSNSFGKKGLEEGIVSDGNRIRLLQFVCDLFDSAVESKEFVHAFTAETKEVCPVLHDPGHSQI